MYKDVLRNALDDVVNDAIDLTADTMEMGNVSLEECFPYSWAKTIEIDGRLYRMIVEIKLR